MRSFHPIVQQQNILKTDEMTEIFLRIAMELCVNAFFKSLAATEGTGADGQPNQPSTQYAYNVIDAFSSMLVILVKYASADPQSVTSRVQFLKRILEVVARVLLKDRVKQ